MKKLLFNKPLNYFDVLIAGFGSLLIVNQFYLLTAIVIITGSIISVKFSK